MRNVYLIHKSEPFAGTTEFDQMAFDSVPAAQRRLCDLTIITRSQVQQESTDGQLLVTTFPTPDGGKYEIIPIPLTSYNF